METHWLADADAVNLLFWSYDLIIVALQKVKEEDTQTSKTKCEAKG